MDGKVIIEVTSADVPGLLDALTRADIIVTELIYCGPLSVRMQIHRLDLYRMQSIIQTRGENWKEVRRFGLYWRLRSIFRHWIFMMGLAVLLLLTALLPTRILFVQVCGNKTIPSRLILEEAATCGISFGADRSYVRSEQVKNRLLDTIPQLQWLGVNTVGCVAFITVQERQMAEQTENANPGNMIAVRDGILLEMTVDRGTTVAKPGQVVRSGEILISGYTDCGGVILFSGAKGEAYGQTRHEVSAVIMENRMVRGELTDESKKISLIIGKKQINFYEDSGILDTGCVKMYSEYYITLPGGWKLPVKLRIITSVSYALTDEILDPEEAEETLICQTAQYLQSHMVAGRILAVKSNIRDYRYRAGYICREMIGRVIHEEIVAEYGEDH